MAGLYKCESLAVHTPDALDWKALPSDFVLQLHWPRTPEFLDRLDSHGFRAVTIARHPLDVLVSILHFAPREPQTAQWLRGEGGDELAICNREPTSQEFLTYATGSRARALLSVAREWWEFPGARQIRYEDLVAEPVLALQALLACLAPPTTNIEENLRELTMEKLRLTSRNEHFWQGRPGLWKTLLPAPVVAAIKDAHSAVFEVLEYRCDPDPALTLESASAAWKSLQTEPSLKDNGYAPGRLPR